MDIENAVSKQHTHDQPLVDIDEAATMRHHHTSSVEDIENAVASQHTHTQPLADIDSAATMRHAHGKSLVDIDDAVDKRHQHTSTLSEIESAVTEKHTHGSALADIDEAVDMRHPGGNDSHTIEMVSGLSSALDSAGMSWKLASNNETIQHNKGYVIDASTEPITLNLEVPSEAYSFKFGYRVINQDNQILITLNGAKWEGYEMDQFELDQNGLKGLPIYSGTDLGWIETVKQ